MMHPTTFDRLIAWSSLLPVLILLAAAYWLNMQVQPLPPASDRNKRHDPDFIVSKFAATTLSEQGTPQYMVKARQMLHYPDDESTHLQDPQLTSLTPNQPALYASASNGTISGKGDEIFLRDDVKIVRAASAQQSEMVFTTSYLRIIPGRDLAVTDQPVLMKDAHNRISAIGMQIDNKARVIKFLSQVSSDHAPNRK